MIEPKKTDRGPLSLDSGLSQSGLQHATCIAYQGHGALILGQSGSGKSGLALDLMSRGAALVSDDQTHLERRGEEVIASAPPAIEGLIEARGLGILNAVPAGPTPVRLVVSLDHEETARLPQWRTFSLLGLRLPLLFRVSHPHFSAAVLQYVAHGRSK